MKAPLNREAIDALMKEDQTIQNEVGKNAQAYLAHQHYNIPRGDLCKIGLASNAGITRAKVSIMHGYDPCRAGRHRKLCDKDEEILFNWIRKLNAKGQTVFVANVIEMVFVSFFLLLISCFIGKSSLNEISNEKRTRSHCYNRMGRRLY